MEENREKNLCLAGIGLLIPLGGVSGRTTIGPNESEKFMIYLSDRYGFNNPDSESKGRTFEWRALLYFLAKLLTRN